MDLRERKLVQKSGFVRHPWETARLAIIARLLKKYSPAPEAVADIGCGDGYIMSKLQEFFPLSAFVGVDSAYPEGVHAIGRVAVFSDIPEAARFLGRSTSVVVLADVIEHVHDEQEFIESLFFSGLANENTVFIVTAPAFGSLFSSHDRQLGHLRRYNERAICGCLSAAGLQPLESGYFFLSLAIARSINVFFEKIIPSRRQKFGEVANWKYGRFAAWLVSVLLLADYYVARIISSCNIKLPGLSVYVVCKKL